MNTQNKFQDINSFKHPQVGEKINILIIVVSFLLFAVSGGLFFAFSEQTAPSSSFSISLLTGAVLVFMLAAILFYAKSKQKVYNATGKVLQKKSYYFGKEKTVLAMDILNRTNFSNIQSFQFEPSGNVRLDTIISTDTEFAMAQIFEFIPHTYEAVTNVYYFNGKQATDFANYIKECNNK